MKFEMLIKEIFNFQDGRTIFVGNVTGEEKLIKKCKCKLIKDGLVIAEIEVEGEMISSNRKTDLRSLSSKNNIKSTNVPYKSKKVVLKCES